MGGDIITLVELTAAMVQFPAVFLPPQLGTTTHLLFSSRALSPTPAQIRRGDTERIFGASGAVE